MDERTPTVILMKGYQHTGKTTVAKAVAKWLRCPVLHLDDILDKLLPNSKNSIPPMSDEQAKHFYTVAKDILIQMLICQLEAQVKHIIVDSCLSFQNYMIERFEHYQFPLNVLIIESKSRNKSLWRKRFEDSRMSANYTVFSWHKCKSWDDIQRESTIPHAHYGSKSRTIRRLCTKKLVLDPYIDVKENELLNPPLDDDSSDACRFYQAIQYCLLAPTQLPQLVVNLSRWGEISERIQQQKPKTSTEGRCKEYGHDVTIYCYEVLSSKLADCSACGEAILKGAAYSCKHCSLSLHKYCAELNDITIFKQVEVELFVYKRLCYKFPEEHSCEPCSRQGKGFFFDCATCLFRTHLKCRLSPTIIRHERDPHFLSLFLLPLNNGQTRPFFECDACGCLIRGMGYGCNTCNVKYHLKCLMLPSEVTIEHVGYKHTMKRMYPSTEYEEDYICHACGRERSPLFWYFYCEVCDYFADINCIDFTTSRVCI